MVKKSFLQKHGGTCSTQVDPVMVCTPVCVQVHVHIHVYNFYTCVCRKL